MKKVCTFLLLAALLAACSPKAVELADSGKVIDVRAEMFNANVKLV